MKTVGIAIGLLLLAFPVAAKESTSYKQWDTFRFTVNNQYSKKFTENMQTHIKKFHTKSPMKTTIYKVNYGPNSNDLIWVMGPVSFAEMDGHSGDKKHDEDWEDNINPYISSYGQSEIWRLMDGLEINNLGDKSSNPEKYVCRYLTVNSAQDPKVVKYLLMQIKQTLIKIGKVKYWSVMDNKFLQGNDNGRHLMTLSSFDSWSELDDDWEFEKNYEAIYGDGSYKSFLDSYNKVFKNQWNEIITVNREMSGL